MLERLRPFGVIVLVQKRLSGRSNSGYLFVSIHPALPAHSLTVRFAPKAT